MVLAELLWINKINRLEDIEIIDAMKTSIEAIVDKIKNKTNLESGFWISTPPNSLKKIMKDKLQDHK